MSDDPHEIFNSIYIYMALCLTVCMWLTGLSVTVLHAETYHSNQLIAEEDRCVIYVAGRNGSPPGSTHHTTLSVPVTRVHSLSNSSTSILSDLSVSPLHSPLLSRSISTATPKKKYNRRRSSAQSQPI